MDGLFGDMDDERKRALIGLLGMQIGGGILAGPNMQQGLGQGLQAGTQFLGQQQQFALKRKLAEQQAARQNELLGMKRTQFEQGQDRENRFQRITSPTTTQQQAEESLAKFEGGAIPGDAMWPAAGQYMGRPNPEQAKFPPGMAALASTLGNEVGGPALMKAMLPKKPSALDQKTSMLQGTGLPKNISDGIAAGRYRTTRDPINGAAQVIDIGTGEIVFGGQKTAQTPLPKSSMPKVDMAEGTGGSGFVANIGNTLADAFGFDLPAKEAETAAQALTNLQIRTQTSMQAAVPGRPSKYLLEQLIKLSVTPNSLFMGDQRAKIRLGQTRDMLKTEIDRMETDILGNTSGFTPQQVAATRANVSQMKGVLADYDSALKGMGKGKPDVGTVKDGYKFKGGDPAKESSWEKIP